MVFESLYQWYALNIPLKYENATVVLHTSCVNYSASDLKQLSQLPFDFLMPNNVFWELKLLQNSKIFAKKAELILSLFGRNTASWDLEELYLATSGNRICISNKNPMIMVFGDLNKQDEFLRSVSSASTDIYIMVSSNWSCANGIATIYSIKFLQGFSARQVKPLASHISSDVITDCKSILAMGANNYKLCGEMFTKTRMYGSNARIYECTLFPDLLVKGYKGFALTGTQIDKIKNLQHIGHLVPSMQIAFPEWLFFSSPQSIVGYSMKKFKNCSAIRSFINTGWDGHDLTTIIKNLFLTIVELHCMHIIINDLSFNNVLIDSNDNVYFVDSDSFQVFDYPGGGITETYQHPEIDSHRVSISLREPRHEYFALAVLLFQCLFFDDPLRQVQTAYDETKLTWSNSSFPLNVKSEKKKINKETLKNWLSQPENLRQLFVDEFTFQKDISIGAWLRVLDILN